MDLSEVRKYNTRNDCWVIVKNKVYDLSDFIDEHPGGAGIILKYAGRDATKSFDPVHPSDTLKKYLKPKYHLGEVAPRQPKVISRPSVPPVAPASTTPAVLKTKPSSNVVDEYDVEYDTHGDKSAIDFESQRLGNANAGSSSTSSANAPIGSSKEGSGQDNNGDDNYDDDDEDPPTPQELRRRTLAKNRPPLSSIFNLHDFEFVARHTLEAAAWAYYSSGADDEITLRENHFGFQRIFFQPKVLVDVTNVDFSCKMLGQKSAVPFYISGTAFGKLGHPDGELIMTRAAHDQGVIQMLSMLTSYSLDEIVDVARDDQPQWLQIYVNRDREITRKIMQHAESRGIKAFFVTVDAPQLGRREKDLRTKDVGNDAELGDNRSITTFIDASLNWSDIAWFRSVTNLPIVLKGIQTVSDSLKAIEVGVKGIVLSNHGGRQLEYSKPPIEVLAELNPILREKGLKGKIDIFIDGGVRRGTDILKAICLGASGVGLGRPFLYSMPYGQEGVHKAMQILKDEIETNMRLLGVTSLDQLNESFVDFRHVGTRYVAEDKMFGSNYEVVSKSEFSIKL